MQVGSIFLTFTRPTVVNQSAVGTWVLVAAGNNVQCSAIPCNSIIHSFVTTFTSNYSQTCSNLVVFYS